MHRFINPLLLWLAHASHADLIRQIQFLKEENSILRSKLPRCIKVTPRERERLVRLGRLVGTAVRHLVSIVTPHTFDRWLKGDTWNKGTRPRPRKPGRPRTPDDIRQIILRIARETGWGYTRILGELKKLNITTVSRSTVVNILREQGLPTGPARGTGTWDAFITRHAKTLWECDFLATRVLTWKGWKDAYVLLFINVASRRCWVSPGTFHPSRRWSREQAIAFVEAHRQDDPNHPTMILRDHDSKFGPGFDAALRRRSITPITLRIMSPNLNAYAERMVQTLQQECLDHFIVFGRRHLDHLVREYLIHYHTERPHQGVGNVPLGPRREPAMQATTARPDPEPVSPIGRSSVSARASPRQGGQLACRERLGGLLRHYGWREAA